MIEVFISVNRRRVFAMTIENDETSSDPNVGNYDVQTTGDLAVCLPRAFRLENVCRGPWVSGLLGIVTAAFDYLRGQS